MVQHLAFIESEEALLYEKLGFVSLNKISSFIAPFKEKTYLLVCHKTRAGSSVDQHMINFKTFISYFLTLRSRIVQSTKIKSTEVKTIGFHIKQNVVTYFRILQHRY